MTFTFLKEMHIKCTKSSNHYYNYYCIVLMGGQAHEPPIGTGAHKYQLKATGAHRHLQRKFPYLP